LPQVKFTCGFLFAAENGIAENLGGKNDSYIKGQPGQKTT